MNTSSPIDVSLHDLSESLAAPFATVTTDDCRKAATAATRKLGAGANTDLVLAMLGVDDTGVVEGVARGYWTQVKIAGPNR